MQLLKKYTLDPEVTLLYQFHAQKALFNVPKICNIFDAFPDGKWPMAIHTICTFYLTHKYEILGRCPIVKSTPPILVLQKIT